MNNLSFVNPKNGYEMLFVPGGEAVFGTGQDDPFFADERTDREKPSFKTDIPGFYIGIYCVTNEQYFKFIKETGHSAPEAADCAAAVWKNGKFPEEKAKHPVVCVDWQDAKVYCDWTGLTLPAELQWEKAARGPDGRIYPWSNGWDKEKCRNYDNKGSGTTCAADDYPQGRSVFGMFNMSGNVWEWCEDWYEIGAYERYAGGDLTPPGEGGDKILRGGSWHGDNPVPFRCAARLNRPPGDKSIYTGFRCVRMAGH